MFIDIAMFAIIGAKLGAGVAYWICFSAYACFEVVAVAVKVLKD